LPPQGSDALRVCDMNGRSILGAMNNCQWQWNFDQQEGT
jgi:hypothetical protein